MSIGILEGLIETYETIVRMRFALLMLRAWGGFDGNFDSEVVQTIIAWIDAGMKTPVPWPVNPFFAEWAERRGWANVGGFVDYKPEAVERK